MLYFPKLTTNGASSYTVSGVLGKRKFVASLHKITSNCKYSAYSIYLPYRTDIYSFWGVFWVDASFPATVESTFSQIAYVGGVDPKVAAARSWLSSLDQPWLLLIEDADEDVNLNNLVPVGLRGTVLITTRVFSKKIYGTSGSLLLENMDIDEADELLLRAASIQSRDVETTDKATAISKTLGFLPLALVHAGTAILEGLCSLNDYIEYFWRSLHAS